MRVLIALLLVAVALPAAALDTTYYVNPSHPTARNLPLANGYGLSPTDSPWISPSYAVAQITGNCDTIVIYPGNPGSDSPYFDYIDYSSETISFVGVSAGGDSPTFTRNGDVFYHAATSGSLANTTIKGMRFYNCRPQYGIVRIFSKRPNWFAFTDNIVDSITMSDADRYHHICVRVSHYGTEQETLTFSNNSFVNIYGGPAITMTPAAAGCTIALNFSNNSVRNASSAIYMQAISANAAGVYAYVSNNIIDSCSAMFTLSGDVAGRGVWYSASLNNDTYTVPKTFYTPGTGGAPLAYAFAFSNNYNVQPLWKYALTDPLARFNYLADTSVAPFTTGSSTGGLLGVLWGWTYVPPAVDSARSPLAYRYQWLLRGRW